VRTPPLPGRPRRPKTVNVEPRSSPSAVAPVYAPAHLTSYKQARHLRGPVWVHGDAAIR